MFNIKNKNPAFQMADQTIHPGERITVALPLPELYSCTPMHMPIYIMHGKKPGPCLVVCSGLYGDEINGTAIVDRLIELSLLKNLAGTLIAIPVVNVYSLLTGSRLFPDRTDLNVIYPGSNEGSYGYRYASFFSQEIFSKANYCISVRTGSTYQLKFPQIRTNIHVDSTEKLARSFQTPVIMHSEQHYGLFSHHGWENPIPTVVYECGEAHRVYEDMIRWGVRGIVRAMRALEMLPKSQRAEKAVEPSIVRSSLWVRTPGSGIVERKVRLGKPVKKGMHLARVRDPFGTKKKYEIVSPVDGLVICINQKPLVNEGDSIVQIAKIKELGDVQENIDLWRDNDIVQSEAEK